MPPSHVRHLVRWTGVPDGQQVTIILREEKENSVLGELAI
jgi:hypothetical protein